MSATPSSQAEILAHLTRESIEMGLYEVTLPEPEDSTDRLPPLTLTRADRNVLALIASRVPTRRLTERFGSSRITRMLAAAGDAAGASRLVAAYDQAAARPVLELPARGLLPGRRVDPIDPAPDPVTADAVTTNPTTEEPEVAVKIAAQLTRANREFNGLDRIEEQLIAQPRGTRYALIAYDIKRVSDEVTEGVKIPTAEIIHIEPVEGERADQVRQMLAEEYEDRTGKSLEGDPTLFDVAPDDERQVPEASADELMAERAEAKAAEAERERAGRAPAGVAFLPGAEPDGDDAA
ncbi:hypothetical protein ABT336_00365 [Micromonospora sp. NPDC000207]|uniref:hypothetical protein n=1 Tax=Micromonospora sp. NPDC000207 TaxID=3154246 RepID=UPI003320ECBC